MKHNKKLIYIVVLALLLLLSLLTLTACSKFARQPVKYVVTFKSGGGTLVSGEEVQEVESGKGATAPVYEREGYDFDGWDKSFDNVTANLIVTAKWKQVVKFTVTFYGSGGTLVSGSEVQQVKKGSGAVAPVYEKSGYSLSWDKAFSNITADITVTAIWTLQEGETSELETLWEQQKELFSAIWGGENGIANQDDVVVQNSFTFSGLEGEYGVKVLTIGGDPLAIECAPALISSTQLAINTFVQEQGLEDYLFEKIPDTNIITTNYISFLQILTGDIKKVSNNYFNNAQTLLVRYLSDVAEYTIPNGVQKIGPYAFTEKAGLSKITFASSVQSIGIRAFAYCNDLAEAIFGSGSNLSILGEGAFYACDSLVQVSLPSRLTNISAFAFSGCDNLSHVSSSSLVSIGKCAFSNCFNLESITMTTELLSIGEHAFAGCESLQAIYPQNIQFIGEGAFEDCTGLTVADIQGNNLVISKDAFNGCANLANLNIVGAISIDDRAFNLCTALASIEFNEGLVSIGAMAFAGTALQYVLLPDSLTELGENAFSSCLSLEIIYIPASVTSAEYGFGACFSLTIYTEASEKPEGWAADWNSIDAYVVWGVKYTDLSQCMQYLWSVNKDLLDELWELPLDIFSLDESYNEMGIRTASYGPIPFAIEFTNSDDANAAIASLNQEFEHMSDFLEFVLIPNTFIVCINYYSFTYILSGDCTFSEEDDAYYSKDGSVLIRYIGDSAEFTIPSGVQTIGSRTFYTSDLELLIIPDNVTTIKNLAFASCSAMNLLFIPASVVEMDSTILLAANDDLVIYTEYEEDALPEGWHNDWNSEGHSVVWGATLLDFLWEANKDTINIPGAFYLEDGYTVPSGEGQTVFGIRAVIHDSGTAIAIQGADQDDAAAILDWINTNLEELEYVLIPNTNIVCLNHASFPLFLIGNYFYDDTTEAYYSKDMTIFISYLGSDTEFVIPDSVTIIANNAFYGNNTLTEVTIPESVTVIEKDAFHEASELEILIIYAITPPSIGNSAIDEGCNIYVPDNSVAAYKAADDWAPFKNYIFPLSDLD